MSVLKEPILKLSQSKSMRGFVSHNPVGRTAARRFVAGESLADAIRACRELNAKGIHVSLDMLGESVTDAAQATAVADDYLHLLDAIAAAGVDANVSVKLTAMGQDIGEDLCIANITRVLERADAHNHTFVRLDMEGSAYTQRTLDTFRTLWQSGHHNVGVVLQSYLHRTAQDVADMIALGVRVRLCKGAYLEPPTIAFPDKADVDANYVRCMERLMCDGNYPGIATHDEKIIAHAVQFAKQNGIGSDRFEFQMLYGVRRDIQQKLVADGWNVRAYVPYGSEWYPYLMRRMAERPANLLFIASNLWRG